jgi:hypothetical protein
MLPVLHNTGRSGSAARTTCNHLGMLKGVPPSYRAAARQAQATIAA